MRRSKVREHIFKMLFSIGFDAADADEQIELYLEQVEEVRKNADICAKRSKISQHMKKKSMQ